MNIKQHIGDKIRDRRKELDLTHQMLADASGLTRSSIINIESGKHSPTLERLFLICCILELPMYQILPDIIKLKKKFVVVEKFIRVKKKQVVWK